MPTDVQQLDSNMAASDADDGLVWTDIRDLGVEGRGWDDTAAFHDRLPARAQGCVPAPVWELSRCSTGMQVRFVTDAPAIAARWTLRNPGLALPHMPATGVSGLDLYARRDGSWRFAGIARPEQPGVNRAEIVSTMTPESRCYRLHLPLYNGVERVEIGMPRDASLEPAPAWDDPRPIVCYGTSIVQGASASRPGMAYPAILSRRLDRPTINLGFSGNGKAERVLAELFGEINAAAYLIDTLPNMLAGQVTERIEPFVATLRRAHPNVPILLVEDLIRDTAVFRADHAQRHAAVNDAFDAVWRRLEMAGDPHLHRVAAADLLGDDGDATVDGTHPTDLGFVRMADVFEPALRRAIVAAQPSVPTAWSRA